MNSLIDAKLIWAGIFVTSLSLSGCLDTDGEIEGAAINDSVEQIELNPEDILPGVLNPDVVLGDVSQLPTPCNANEILEWSGTEWRCVSTPSVAGGSATTVPASGIQAGNIGAGVTLPATQLTGFLNPSTQIAAGAINAGATLTSAQLRSGCADNQILVSDATGSFSCANQGTAPIDSVFGRTGDVLAVAGDYNATQVTNVAAGNVSATNVQAAINELDTEKLALAGGAMTGSINMGSNVISNVGAPVAGTDATTKAYVDTAVAGAAGAPGGATTQVQFNNAGAFAGDAGFVWDNVNKRLGLGTTTPEQKLHVVNNAGTAARLEKSNGGGNVLSLVNTNDSGTGANGTNTQLNFSQETLTEGTVEPVGALRFRASDATAGAIDSTFQIITYENGVNSAKVTVGSDGNVGIGTGSPESILHIESDSTPIFDRQRTHNGTSSGAALRLVRSFDGGVGAAGIGVHQDFYVETSTEGVTALAAKIGAITTDATTGGVDSSFYVQTVNGGVATEAMRFDNNGNIGIGTTLPTEKMHIEGGDLELSLAGARTGDLWNGNSTQDGAKLRDDGVLELQRSSLNPSLYISKNSSLGAIGAGNLVRFNYDGSRIGGINSINDDSLLFWSKNGLRFNGRDSITGTDMIVDSSGNVGIGTTAPRGKIETTSDAGILPDLLMNGSGTITADNGMNLIIDGNNDSTASVFRIGKDSLALTGSVELFRVGEDGSVGIGTPSPDVELDVNTGTINAAAICDESNANCIDLSSGIAASSIRRLSSAPGSGFVTGDVYFNTTDDLTYVYSGASWIPIAQNGDSNSILSDANPAVNLPAVEGNIAYNSSTNKLEFYNGTSWVTTEGAGGAGDFLAAGTVPMTGNIRLNGNFLSGDGGNEGVFVGAAGNVGVGTTAPADKFHVYGTDGANGDIGVNSFGVGVRSIVRLRSGRGTAAAPSATQLADTLGIFGVSGHDGTAFAASGSVAFEASENWTASNQGTDILFKNTADGATTSTERMRIESDGNVGIGTDSPQTKLHIFDDFLSPAQITLEQDVLSDDYEPQIILRNHYNNYWSSFPEIKLINNGGSAAANTATRDNQRIGVLSAYGYDGSGEVESANITFIASDDFAAGNMPSEIVFKTGVSALSQSMIITENGDVGISNLAPTAALSVSGDANKSSGGSTWGVFSDARLKDPESFKDFQYGLEHILQLNPLYYRYSIDNELGLQSDEDNVGFIAQKVQEVIPEAVSENSSGFLEINSDPIIWSMLNAIKELANKLKETALKFMNKISLVETQVAELKKENEQIKAENAEIKKELAEIKQMLRQNSRAPASTKD